MTRPATGIVVPPLLDDHADLGNEPLPQALVDTGVGDDHLDLVRREHLRRYGAEEERVDTQVADALIARRADGLRQGFVHSAAHEEGAHPFDSQQVLGDAESRCGPAGS
ncbi:hypothetical protein [Amycolatopsis thermoflava]|uniref:hypothetical protein n=1 Tax=Amycolatopsis thermoflava TaxID=84480 RepID=UPI003EBEDE08